MIFITKAVVGLHKAKCAEHPVGAQSVADTSYSARPSLLAAQSRRAILDSACGLAGPLPLAARALSSQVEPHSTGGGFE